MKQLAQVIHRGLDLEGEPQTITLKEAKQYSPIAEGLARNSAMSGDLAKQTLGWSPCQKSILKEVEYQARVSRRELGHVVDPCFGQRKKTRKN